MVQILKGQETNKLSSIERLQRNPLGRLRITA